MLPRASSGLWTDIGAAELQVTEPGVDGGATTDAGAPPVGGDAAVQPGHDAATADGADAGRESPEMSSGCGCRAASGSSVGTSLLISLLLAALTRRRP